jgi:hypothetical protein
MPRCNLAARSHARSAAPRHVYPDYGNPEPRAPRQQQRAVRPGTAADPAGPHAGARPVRRELFGAALMAPHEPCMQRHAWPPPERAAQQGEAAAQTHRHSPSQSCYVGRPCLTATIARFHKLASSAAHTPVQRMQPNAHADAHASHTHARARPARARTHTHARTHIHTHTRMPPARHKAASTRFCTSLAAGGAPLAPWQPMRSPPEQPACSQRRVRATRQTFPRKLPLSWLCTHQFEHRRLALPRAAPAAPPAARRPLSRVRRRRPGVARPQGPAGVRPAAFRSAMGARVHAHAKRCVPWARARPHRGAARAPPFSGRGPAKAFSSLCPCALLCAPATRTACSRRDYVRTQLLFFIAHVMCATCH